MQDEPSPLDLGASYSSTVRTPELQGTGLAESSCRYNAAITVHL